jgi:nitrate/nitrite transporter NarK
VAGLVVLIVGLNAYYIVPAGVLPVVQEQLAVGPASASLLVSAMFGTQMVLGVPIGVLLDRVDNRRAIVAATVLTVLVYGWSWQAATAGDFWTLLASRGAAAPLTSVVFTAAVNLIGRAFEPERRATAVGVFTAGPPAGFAIGLLTGPLVAAWSGWADVFIVYAPLAVLGAVALWVTSRELDVAGDDADTARAADFGRLLATREIWTIAFVAFAGLSLYAFVTSWTPTFLTETLGVSLAEAGLLSALFPAIGAVARLSSGAVSDVLFGHRRRPVLLLGFGVSSPAILLIVLADTVAVVFLALLLAGGALQLGLGLAYAVARETADPEVAATGVAIVLSAGLFGGFVAPPIGGALIDLSGYLAAFGYAVATGLAGLGLSWFVPEPDL